MADNRGEMQLLNKQIEKLNLKDTEKNQTLRKKCLVLKDKQLDELTSFDNVLCTSRSKTEEHPKELIEIASTISLSPHFVTKIADTIEIDRADQIFVGHVVNIIEEIILNTDENEFEFSTQKMKDCKDYFPMIDRKHWSARPSVSETTYLNGPAKYVIICHTASHEFFTQEENILLVRRTQAFHIDSQGWSDIGYNFCIGSDGNVYEGRGWFAQGSHTLSYNQCSVGIAFIGCFLNNLPPETSLKKCKDLITHGVRIGAIKPDYELLAHCQCRPFLSPGDRLFREIQTWDHFNPQINNTTPCKLPKL